MGPLKKMLLGRGLLAAMEGYGTPVWLVHRKSLRFLYANQAALQLYGYTLKELRRLTLRDIRPAFEMAGFNIKVKEQAPALRYMGIWKHYTKTGHVLLMRIWVVDITYGLLKARLVKLQDITPAHAAHSLQPN